MTTTKDALPQDEFWLACSLMPTDVSWGDSLTPALVLQIAALASKQAEAQAKSEPAALTDAQIEAGAISLGRMWKWEMLEESYRAHYRTRFRDAITAAIAATKDGENGNA